MIHSSTIIQWADINRSIVETAPVKILFQSYAERITGSTNGSPYTVIEFGDKDNVQIRDWTGWTKIISIKRIDTPCDWVKVTSGDKEIIIEKTSIIPAYRVNDKKRGYHGEEKFAYVGTIAELVDTSDMARLVKHEPEFMQMNTTLIEDSCFPYTRYGIQTASGFYNANDFHLLAMGLMNGETIKHIYSSEKRYK